MIDALLDLPSHLRERLASALDTGLLGSPPTVAALATVLGTRDGAEDVIASLLDLSGHGNFWRAAAAWLRTVAHAAARSPKPDVVWSGPEVPGLYARDTRRVYEESPRDPAAEHSTPEQRHHGFGTPRAQVCRPFLERLARLIAPKRLL